MEKNKDVGPQGPQGDTGPIGATGPVGATGKTGSAGAVTVTSQEPGIVLTGTIAQAFEARILASVQKLFFTQFVLLIIVFVWLFGMSIFLSRLNSTLNSLDDTVNNTDEIVSRVTGPEAVAEQQKAQAQVVQKIIDDMNCADQHNLQRAIDNLVPNAESIIEEKCVKET